MKKILVLGIILLLLITGCTNTSKTVEVLEQKGYTNVQITGWDALACGEDDLTATGFIATNSAGNLESGTVCCGFLKRCTVRN